MNADLLEGDEVAFRDSGHEGGAVLANETILTRGLVVRSHGNRISVRLRSQNPRPRSILLRYQGDPPPPVGTPTSSHAHEPCVI